MTVLTTTAALFLALHQCPGLPPALAPVAVGIGLHESGLRTDAVNLNRNGTIDVGLGQVNSSNFGWLSAALASPVNERTLLDPCLNLRASAAVLMARYNGNAAAPVKAAYSADVLARISAVPVVPVDPAPAAPNPFSRPSRIGRDAVYAIRTN